jgi:hypothetical protein
VKRYEKYGRKGKLNGDKIWKKGKSNSDKIGKI